MPFSVIRRRGTIPALLAVAAGLLLIASAGIRYTRAQAIAAADNADGGFDLYQGGVIGRH